MLEQAIALHRQGRLPEAEEAYRAILAREPENAGVGHLLGKLALDAGMPDAAVPILEHVVMLAPGNPAFLTDLGTGYHRMGRAADALRVLDRALALDDAFLAAHFYRGVVLMESDPPAALESFDRVVALDPASAPAHNYRGLVLTHLVRLEDALAAFETALRLNPENPMAHSNAGFALGRVDRHEDAVRHFEAALAMAPDNGDFHYNLAGALRPLRRLQDAQAALTRALALKPDFADAYVNRGLVHTELMRLEDAMADFDRAIALRPDLKSARLGRSGALVVGGRADEALAYNREMAKTAAFKAEVEYHSAFLLLQRGQWDEAWTLYEARRLQDSPTETRSYPQAEWLGGGTLAGKTLYVYGEQGLGDVIMFSRYLSLAKAAGAQVIFAPQDKLARLMQSLKDKVDILPWKTAPDSFDLHMPLMSMPLAFGTRPDSIPTGLPYLAAEPALVEKWRERIGTQGFRIGVCWMGSQNAGLGLDRSFPLRELAPLAALPGVRLISLQRVDGLQELSDLPAGMIVENLGEDFDAGGDAFVDTAAAMQSLDLVISCDTSVAHLAGALARPCWTALKHEPEWRWILQDETTPWYPGMRLFRQPARDDWRGVFAAMAAQLKAGRA